MLPSRSFCLFFPCLHSPPSNSQQMGVVDRHSAVSEAELTHHRGMSPHRRQAQGWTKVRQGCIWLFWQWTAAGGLFLPQKGEIGEGCSFMLHGAWRAVGGQTASSRCKRSPRGLSLGLGFHGSAAWAKWWWAILQLLCLPVLCLLWKKMPGTKASIQTQADTAHLGLAGSSLSGFKASERMGLAKGHFAACISSEKLCLLCYQSWEKGLWEKKGRTTRIWLWSWEERESRPHSICVGLFFS